MTSSTLAQDFLTAAEQGQLEKLKECLDNGVDINVTNRQGRTAIINASLNKHYESVSFLINAGADIDKQDQTCFNPFLLSCLNNDLTLLRLVLPANPNLDLLTRFGGVGITPASEKGHVEIVRELLEKTEINVNHTNFVGWTPLLEAIVLNDGGDKQQQIVKLLLEHGANPHMTDKYGKKPLELAKDKGYTEIAALLVAAGA
ncbi:ankyrin repeat domain-containing protein [Klebsiella sp. BIGb0407]|uniref:ankyrin repeat domain-containing protein n=1 Tax=Klebsiella sp. BIGb0407 TaxID=2940603 RepID=UPI002167466D|nr:ankyrin repeat domain-containing protein [Klebsiella sp. BIGb0407]MCS3432661.1 ankyrin repeat protein [Klebsiella sp. BIGb0407]